MKDNKPWYEKIYIWIGIIAGICTILAFIITITKNNTKESINTLEDNNNSQDNIQAIGNDNITINGNISGDININKNESPETKISSESKTTETEIANQFNFGQAMQIIFSNEEILQKEIINNKESKPINSSIFAGVSYWYILNDVRLISVAKDFRDERCSRTYYFDENGKLTFALMCDNKGEHRLYFYNDILIRYIDEKGDNYDIDINLSEHECEWTNFALEESYEVFNGVKNSADSDDILVTASYNPNTSQTSQNGVNILVSAKTSFPADCVTISAISDENVVYPMDMHGGKYEWYFVANFYIKGTYIITITAYDSEGKSVSDSFEYVY